MREIVPCQTTRVVCQGKRNDEDHADDSGAEPNHGYENPVPVLVARITTRDKENNFDGATRGTVEKRLLGGVAKTNNELGEEV